ncbi:dimethylamine corrinoid protein 3 [Methanosarcina sp. 2.H.T.1A.6]|uniref:cobalamin B12-binding domain-containing protein n=1 Tax=unclassified Methanosarcina TaxID=2644672 RepID=UPI00062125AA|nr:MULTISPECIES: B12-binding domain-containing protein [unclassified Methanosarcina]KKG12025.1 dimethylamine corrinoid protein 3 [Methanosarcina sp. 2.H.T.1A.15]KKG15915.1 dimethylamine corrinoid protein 3 [Methanosarcina sp. 2.H.T.1A.3]KKG21054.1 dimethylamine corrinoid protein 3 [Methanosarcina sp. 2.H.T.1A.6]KKG23800.1 dimethylamine corrinoid protein 3 [Methanosarcina sp. 2.H.T.1A.8]
MSNENLLEIIRESIVKVDRETAVQTVESALAQGLQAIEVIEKGLSPGMQKVGDLFERGELFLPQVMMAAGLMTQIVQSLQDKMSPEQTTKKNGVVIIGTVEGDVHDIGKNIVKILLSVNGFEVHDLGRDALLSRFVEKAKEFNANIVASSALMTGTMQAQGDLETLLKEAGIRDRVKTMVGGAPCTQYWADKIGANAYAENASEAVTKARELMAAQ